MELLKGKEAVKNLTGNIIHGLYESVDKSEEYTYLEAVFEMLKEQQNDRDLFDLCWDYIDGFDK